MVGEQDGDDGLVGEQDGDDELVGEQDGELEPPRKKSRTHSDYVFVRTFDSEKEVFDYLISENWSKYYQSSSEAGMRQMLRCPKVKFRGPQCAAKAYFLYDSTSTQIHFYKTVADHDHDQNINSVYEIPESTKNEIKNMFDLGVTRPKRILNNLMLKKIELPERRKLDSFLKELKKEKFGPSNINLIDLKHWLEDNLVIPIDKTKPFIVDFKLSLNENNPGFKFFVSTKQLLALATSASHVHVDGTYKLVWQGYPIIQIGNTDMHRSFHPFGLGVCTSEQSADYEFIFNAVTKGVKDVYGIDYHPNTLIRDGAHSIQNGFEAVFGDGAMGIMCWAHMRRKMVENMPKYIRNKKQRFELLDDLDMLQLSKNNETFDRAATLFVEKWRIVSADAMDYFTLEWLRKNRFWYEGVKVNTPSTNNAIEVANRIIKDEHTLRERFDLGQFRTVLFQMMESWSLAYVNGEKEFHNSPEIELKRWTDAYTWAKQNVCMKVTEEIDRVVYKIPNGIDTSATGVQNDEWNSFEDFKVKNFQSNYVIFPAPLTKHNWQEGVCDCSSFFKLYMCEHVLGISLRMKFVVAPDEAKALPLGQKRKRGRPARAKAALVIQ